jgi:hypothetical protein
MPDLEGVIEGVVVVSKTILRTIDATKHAVIVFVMRMTSQRTHPNCKFLASEFYFECQICATSVPWGDI